MRGLPMDKNLYWTGLIYFSGLLLLGVPWWKALTVAAVAFICWYLTYGRRIIIGIGLCIFILGSGNWLGLVPAPSQWGQVLAANPG
jgi:hypothetical protein